MTVNSVAPDKSGNVVVGIPELEQLKGKVVQLENDDHAYSLLKTIAEALGMQVGAGGSWTGTAYVSLGAFATKNTIGPDDLTPELKAQLKGDKGDVGQVGPQGPRGIQGVQGEQGERGPQGEPGDTGLQGPQGPQGPQGAPLVVTRTQESSDPGGYNTVTLSDGTTLNIRNGIVGPTGQRGEQGEQGEKGDTGAKGEKGDKGDKGDRGADGTVAFDYLTEEQKASLKGDKGDPGEIPTIDSALDLTSTNPVMNSVVTAELQNLRALVISQYYPEGNVKNVSELTAGIKYNFAEDGAERTATVKPFCNTGDPENDNSGLAGRVVIPPFVDAQGNPYISDDGTRYKVVGVYGGDRDGDNVNLTSIIAPSTVTNIGDSEYGDSAFAGCSALTSVSLPAVTTIGPAAFSDCVALTSISLPTATTIKTEAFFRCSRLAYVSLPAATTIGSGAFTDCDALASVSLPAATIIWNGGFSNCYKLTSVSLPSATAIGESAFGSCEALASVSLPAATAVEDNAFSGCDALTSVSLPAATNLGWFAFAYCSRLISVDFGATPRSSVPTIGSGAFDSVPTSCKIIVPDAQYDEWVAAPGWSDLVTAGYTFLRHSEWGYARKYEVENKADKPATFTAGNLAEFDSNGNPTDSGVAKYDFEPLLTFAKCYPEGNVNSEADLTRGIKYDAPDTTDRTITVKPFCVTGDPENDNSSLAGRVVIPPFVDSDGNPYISDDGTRYKVVGVSSNTPVESNRNLTAIVAPNTVSAIGDMAFVSCEVLTSVSLPAVTTIGFGGISSCFSLTTISLPAATTIGEEALYRGEALISVDFGGTPRSSVPELGLNAFQGIPTSCKIIVPDAQYDEWVADPGWSDLVAAGYTFLRHSEWEDSLK